MFRIAGFNWTQVSRNHGLDEFYEYDAKVGLLVKRRIEVVWV